MNNCLLIQSVAPGFHYFSDTELGGNSPMASRPGSPVHSDGELEKSNKEEASAWRWGELPSPVSARPPVVQVRFFSITGFILYRTGR